MAASKECLDCEKLTMKGTHRGGGMPIQYCDKWKRYFTGAFKAPSGLACFKKREGDNIVPNKKRNETRIIPEY